jgi:NAD(P)-dependent dehydrogenase (short-subunit alcohol dehydrogenase family)
MRMSEQEFAGKAVIVTGAASGLGKATALAFAKTGAKLALADVNPAGLEETVAKARAAGAEVLSVPTDVSDVAACLALPEKTVEALGRIDAVCNVAGIVLMEKMERVTQAQWDKIYAVNVRGPFFILQAAVPHLRKSEGAIVNIASASALIGHAYLAPYSSSKGAMLMLSKTLAMEFMKEPIRVNCVCPGGMNTGMVNQHIPADLDFKLVERFSGMRPMAEPEELTDLIIYLASPRSKAVHGGVFSVDAGVTAG